VKAAREGEHIGHDVRADMVVEDLAHVGDHEGVRDQFGVVIAAGGAICGDCSQRSLRARRAAAGAATEGGVGVDDAALACASSSATTTSRPVVRRRGAAPRRGWSRSVAVGKQIETTCGVSRDVLREGSRVSDGSHHWGNEGDGRVAPWGMGILLWVTSVPGP